ncbi:hypothetical protein KBC70_00540 [Candidatus Woesebacteria bacterium]|jgi:hypothetical protein|nr:hypothetical protein [Candidatus Woesebacteria bacterium]
MATDIDTFGLDLDNPSHAPYFRRALKKGLRDWQALLDDAEVECDIAAYDLRDRRRKFHVPIRESGNLVIFRLYRRNAWRDYLRIRIGLERIRERVHRIQAELHALNERYPEE